MTQVLAYKSVVPAAPREISRRAARRAWAELPVQLWWKMAVVVLLIAAVVAYGEIQQNLRIRRLMANGTPVKARLIEVAQTKRAGFAVQRNESVPVKLQWNDPATGNEQTATVVLPPGPGYAKVDQILDIRVDPNDPQNFAEESEVQPWTRALAIPLFMLLPIAAGLIALAWWQRRRVLEVWRTGSRADGIVIACTHAAMSPKSRICRFTYADGRDRRVFKLLYPSSRGVPKKGDGIQLISPFDAPEKAIAAELYMNPQAVMEATP